MTYIIGMVSQKGGVGKSTLARMMAREIADGGMTHGSGAVARSVLTSSASASRWTEPPDWRIGGSNVRRFGPRS